MGIEVPGKPENPGAQFTAVAIILVPVDVSPALGILIFVIIIFSTNSLDEHGINTLGIIR